MYCSDYITGNTQGVIYPGMHRNCIAQYIMVIDIGDAECGTVRTIGGSHCDIVSNIADDNECRSQKDICRTWNMRSCYNCIDNHTSNTQCVSISSSHRDNTVNIGSPDIGEVVTCGGCSHHRDIAIDFTLIDRILDKSGILHSRDNERVQIGSEHIDIIAYEVRIVCDP